MKYFLLLFTLLSFACSGQQAYWFIGDSAYAIHQWQLNTVPYSQLDAEDEKIITMELLLRYADECYNDSTERIAIGKNGGVYYIHRKPTFAGFVEWLRNK